MKYNFIDFSDMEKFKIHGRIKQEDNGFVLSWCNSGVSFNFLGSGFMLSFREQDEHATVYVKIFIDNERPQRFCVPFGDNRIIIEGLEDRPHEVKILRVTEGVPVTAGGLTLVGDDPVLLEKPDDKPVKIEFYGDSITCGYGVAAPKGAPGFTFHEEDSTMAYAYMTAQILNADITTICISGKGIVSNCEGNRQDNKISEFYKWRTGYGDVWDFKKWVPDIVVVNAGTNDSWGGVSDDEFYEGSMEFLVSLRCLYPCAYFIWAYGIMDEQKLPTVKRIVEDFNKNDGKTRFLHIPSINGNPNEAGGGGHPNTELSKRASVILADFIKKEIL